MRDYRFRGKILGTGEWIEGDLCRHYENQRRFIAYDQMFYTYAECGIKRLVSERFFEVDPATVGQFTGLYDADGKEIWEGDIVTGRFNCEKISGRIVYGSDGTFFVERPGFYGIGLNNAEIWLTVIGTIHDAPGGDEK
jgi:uncharacterized phage protein (TIGR01671 family)